MNHISPDHQTWPNRVRIFGADDCPKCQHLKQRFNDEWLYGPFVFIDANADDTQELCDDQCVNELPQVQLLDEQGNVVWDQAGEYVTYDFVVENMPLQR